MRVWIIAYTTIAIADEIEAVNGFLITYNAQVGAAGILGDGAPNLRFVRSQDQLL